MWHSGGNAKSPQTAPVWNKSTCQGIWWVRRCDTIVRVGQVGVSWVEASLCQHEVGMGGAGHRVMRAGRQLERGLEGGHVWQAGTLVAWGSCGTRIPVDGEAIRPHTRAVTEGSIAPFGQRLCGCVAMG